MTAKVFVLFDPARPLLSETFAALVAAVSPSGDHPGRVTPRTTVRLGQPQTAIAFFAQYDHCCDMLRSAAAHSRRAIVWMLAGEGGEDLNPLAPSFGYGRLCAMLALTFPDILFIRVATLDDVLTALWWWESGYSPLMDGTRLRDDIRSKMRNKAKSIDVKYLPARRDLAVAIDDEEAYSFLHALVGYRFGFRAIPVGTEALASHLLSDQAAKMGIAVGLTFEDVFIRFADRTDESEHLSDLKQRSQVWPQLAKVRQRVLVSSGYDQAGDEKKKKSNAAFIATEVEAGRFIIECAKPHAGMFRLRDESELTTRLTNGVGPGYVWPPPSEAKPVGEVTSHSADGTLVVIAQRLLVRAEELLAQGDLSVAEAVHGAVFATDALELLGGRTPAVSVEALRIRHELELTAECRFSGLKYHIGLAPRLDEIERDVEIICGWFTKAQREQAKLNARMAIFSRLVIILRNFAKFDEEQLCMHRIRRLQHALWRREHWWRRLAFPCHWYFEQLLCSLPRFFFWIAVWIGLLWAAYGAVLGDPWAGLESAVSSFFSVGTPAFYSAGLTLPEGQVALCPAHAALIALSVVMGFLHLGVFISHLYSVVARK